MLSFAVTKKRKNIGETFFFLYQIVLPKEADIRILLLIRVLFVALGMDYGKLAII